MDPAVVSSLTPLTSNHLSLSRNLANSLPVCSNGIGQTGLQFPVG